MNQDILMFIRYGVIAYMSYKVGSGSPLIDPTVDLIVAGATVLWGAWQRWKPSVVEWFKSKAN